MGLSAIVLKGQFEGREVLLSASTFSGLETLSVDGHEVSRCRSFRFKTTHDLSASGLGVDCGVVRIIPSFRLELRRGGESVAMFEDRLVLPILIAIGVLVGLAILGMLLVLGPRVRRQPPAGSGARVASVQRRPTASGSRSRDASRFQEAASRRTMAGGATRNSGYVRS